jgi:hypothetical protein
VAEGRGERRATVRCGATAGVASGRRVGPAATAVSLTGSLNQMQARIIGPWVQFLATPPQTCVDAGLLEYRRRRTALPIPRRAAASHR